MGVSRPFACFWPVDSVCATRRDSSPPVGGIPLASRGLFAATLALPGGERVVDSIPTGNKKQRRARDFSEPGCRCCGGHASLVESSPCACPGAAGRRRLSDLQLAIRGGWNASCEKNHF